LPIASVTQEIPVDRFPPDFVTEETPITREPLGPTPVEQAEARLEHSIGVESEVPSPVEPEPFLEPEDNLGKGNPTVMESSNCLETEVAGLLKPAGEDLDPVEVTRSPGAGGPKEPQIATEILLSNLERASTSREGALIGSLKEGLLACPLEALLEILPEELKSVSETGSSGELADAILHAQFQVSFTS
jgi:hypothetical protein